LKAVKTLQQLIELIGDLALRIERKDAQIVGLQLELLTLEASSRKNSDSRPRLHLAK
jgi:hypothetical protein